jgi:hypothetical protein
VAPDAVVGLVERTDEAGAGIGQREAVAAAQMLGVDPVRARPLQRERLRMRDEVLRIGPARRLEQHAAAHVRAAGRRVQRPRRVAQREIELGRVRGLLLHPGGDVRREGELVEAPAEALAQLALQRGAVERLRVFRRDPRGGATLDELALDRVDGRGLVVPASERGELGADAEELREKMLQAWRNRQDQRRLLLGRQGRRIGARRLEPRAERGVGGAECGEKCAIECDEAVAAVEIGKIQPEAEG